MTNATPPWRPPLDPGLDAALAAMAGTPNTPFHVPVRPRRPEGMPISAVSPYALRCPYCAAPPGNVCRSRNRDMRRQPHAVRITRAADPLA